MATLADAAEIRDTIKLFLYSQRFAVDTELEKLCNEWILTIAKTISQEQHVTSLAELDNLPPNTILSQEATRLLTDLKAWLRSVDPSFVFLFPEQSVKSRTVVGVVEVEPAYKGGGTNVRTVNGIWSLNDVLGQFVGQNVRITIETVAKPVVPIPPKTL